MSHIEHAGSRDELIDYLVKAFLNREISDPELWVGIDDNWERLPFTVREGIKRGDFNYRLGLATEIKQRIISGLAAKVRSGELDLAEIFNWHVYYGEYAHVDHNLASLVANQLG